MTTIEIPFSGTASDEFYTYSRAVGIKASTLKTFMIYITQYTQWCREYGIDIHKATTGDILAYRTYLVQQEQYTNATITNKLVAMHAYYEYWYSTGKMMSNPVSVGCYFKKRRGLIRNVLSIPVMGTLLGGIVIATPFDYLFKSVCELLYSTGVRISECMGLHEGDIEWHTGYIRVHDSKTDTLRRVPIGEVALRWLREYMTHGRDILVGVTDRHDGCIYPQYPHCKGRINLRLRAECKRHSFAHLSVHCFRHSCATHMLQKGANIKQVQEFLGHATITATQIYTHVVTDDLKKLVSRYHPRGGSV